MQSNLTESIVLWLSSLISILSLDISKDILEHSYFLYIVKIIKISVLD